MTTNLLKGVEHRFDADETLFLARQLESIEAQLYKTLNPDTSKYRMHIPVSHRDNPGAENITYRMLTNVGMAKIIANYADDLPRVDAFMQEFTQKVKTIGASFGFSTQEVRSAIMNNVSLDSVKGASLQEAFQQKESALAWNGDSVLGIKGFFDNPNIPLLAAVNGGGGSPLWANKTPAEILADISTGVTKVRVQSKGLHNADTLLLSIDRYNVLATTPRSTNTDLTLLEYIQKPGNSFGLRTIDWLPFELDTAFTGGTETGAVFYQKNPENIEQRIPLERTLLPVQSKNLEFVTNAESRHGGVVVRRPLAALFLTGI